MTPNTLELTDQQVVDHARDLLHAYRPLSAASYACTIDDLLNVLLGIATNRGTLEVACQDWLGLVRPATVRGYFNAQLRVEDLPELERRLNAALRAEIPRRIWRQAQHVALDFHDRPYYGKRPQSDGLWVRGASPRWDDALLSTAGGLCDPQGPARNAGGPVCLA
jgi:hypothetical protein